METRAPLGGQLNPSSFEGMVIFAVVLGSVYMSTLALLTLIKPNVLLVAGLLSASFWALRDRRTFALSSIVAGALKLIWVAIPCVYFVPGRVWKDWRGYLYGTNKVFSSSISAGNASTMFALSDALNMNINVVMTLGTLLLWLHAFWVLLRTKPALKLMGKHLRSVTILAIQDPCLCAALGIIVMLAVSPLVWYQHYVLSLFPAFWLMRHSPSWDRAEFFGLASIVLSSAVLSSLFPFLRKGKMSMYVPILGWVPLWFGFQAALANKNQHPFQFRRIIR